MSKIRIAAFGGFRDIPPKAGAAGSDKFALELYPRIAHRGYEITRVFEEYLKYTSSPRFITTEKTKSAFRSASFLLRSILPTKKKSIRVVPIMTKINFGAPQA